ncbi:hypothetical protein [Mesorhizobium sp. M8A.F.Ca.ET.021.01.1.1]|uniref:hypothetical protein n=1 Tax=Mesorhizobium sp. M8A.F.Ca.ET.021.01.1.1 TaxID=2496757 RepID=UPI000FC9E1DB|nr:hypothetical protein [Mesorhizobium sp. M8A.F.Ca.ET.021.01.1.1]RUW56718.1 hypothetical protein EOA36_02725 [Mesorhizobium sp. M8A.F.Ca.ET.021.01.1.1]
MHPIDRILDGWFGEALTDAEDSEHRGRHLYEPLRKAFNTVANNTVYDYRIASYCMTPDDLAKKLSEDSGQGWNLVSISIPDTRYVGCYHISQSFAALQSKKRT